MKYEAKTFNGMTVELKPFHDDVCFVTMRGEADGGAAAFNAGIYFWKLVSDVSREIGKYCGCLQWIFDMADRFDKGYKTEKTFILNGGKELKVTIENDENETYGPYTMIGFMRMETEG